MVAFVNNLCNDSLGSFPSRSPIIKNNDTKSYSVTVTARLLDETAQVLNFESYWNWTLPEMAALIIIAHIIPSTIFHSIPNEIELSISILSKAVQVRLFQSRPLCNK